MAQFSLGLWTHSVRYCQLFVRCTWNNTARCGEASCRHRSTGRRTSRLHVPMSDEMAANRPEVDCACPPPTSQTHLKTSYQMRALYRGERGCWSGWGQDLAIQAGRGTEKRRRRRPLLRPFASVSD